MRSVVVTTAGRPDETSVFLAKQVSADLGAPLVPRNKRSIRKISEEYHACVIVAGKNRLEYYSSGDASPFFFHPDTAAFRLKRIVRGEEEPFLEACQLEKGDSFLDCTLGIGSDSIIASYVVGKQGRVVGLEVNPNVAYIVQKGLKEYESTNFILEQSMRRIEVMPLEATQYLKNQPDNSFDVVYLDPMFEEIIEESNNFEALRQAGNHIPLTEEWVREAYRVARKRVVLKAHFRSIYFKEFGFQQQVRLTSKFHYGVMDKNETKI